MWIRPSHLFVAATFLHTAAWAQTAAPGTATDPRALLLRVRESVTNTLLRLPRYLCTLTIDRAQYTPVKDAGSCEAPAASPRNQRPPRIAVTDRLRLDVAIAAANEIYSWVGEDRFDNPDVFDLVKDGALQTGVYATFLASIFRDDVASFSYTGATKVNGRELAGFSFEIPRERSRYIFGNRVEQSIVGYGGSFLVDPGTADLVRLTVRTAALPEESGACQATTTLDYTRMRLNDSEFLLPSHAQLDILNLDGVELRNSSVYSSCHEFVGEAVLKFGDADAGSSTAGASAATSTPAPLPAGAVFRIRFNQPIDPRTAAAGDRIQAQLATPINDPATNAVLVPEAAAITARIVKLQRFTGPPATIQMLVKLETIDRNGSARPLAADYSPTGLPPAAAPNAPIPLGGWNGVADRRVAAFQFENADAKFVVKSGLESTWTTSADPAGAAHP